MQLSILEKLDVFPLFSWKFWPWKLRVLTRVKVLTDPSPQSLKQYHNITQTSTPTQWWTCHSSQFWMRFIFIPVQFNIERHTGQCWNCSPFNFWQECGISSRSPTKEFLSVRLSTFVLLQKPLIKSCKYDLFSTKKSVPKGSTNPQCQKENIFFKRAVP